MSETNIKVSLELADKAAQKALSDFISKSESADKSLDKLKRNGGGAFNELAVHIGKATGVYEIFQGNLAANLATKAFDAIAASAGQLFNLLVTEGIKAASEQESANNALNIALAQTGIYSDSTAQEFQELASQIQATTGVADDAVISNAALIQSLGQLDKDGLKRATVAAVDLSAALGKDLATTSEALAKAANGNTSAIQKMGLSFQKGRTDAETFQNILESLEDRFGGSAAAKVNTFAGAVDLTKAAFGDLQEEVGNTIIQNSVVIEVLKTAGKILGDLTSEVNGNKDSFKKMVGEGIIITIDAMLGLAAVTDSVVRVVTSGFRFIQSAMLGLATIATKVMSLFDDDMKEIAEATARTADEVAASVSGAFTEDTNLGKATQILARLRDGAITGMNALSSGANASIKPLNNLAAGTKELTDEQKKANAELEKWAMNLAKSTFDGEAQMNAQIEAFRLQKEEQLLASTDFLNRNAEAELAFFDKRAIAEQDFYASQQFKLKEALDKKLIDETEYADASLAIQTKLDTAYRKNEIEKQKFQREVEKQKLADTQSTLGTISTLQNSKSRELFEIGKAAAIANATISTYEGIAKAWALGPIIGPPLAALVGVAGFAQVANISSMQPAFEDGGIVPGSSFSGDKISARVNSGEMILNRAQQKELFSIANGSGGNDSLLRSIDAKLGALLQRDDRMIVNIGGKTVVDTLRSELNAGRSFA